MPRRLIVILLFLPALLFASEQNVAFIYYYAWYGTPEYDGAWIHWQENNHKPPDDLASAYYPSLGPYSSRNPSVIGRHMQWISRAGVDVLIYSWWGRGDLTDELAGTILDAAAAHDLKLAFLIEPYPGRTPHKICDDIENLNERFQEHPAFYQTDRTTAQSINRKKRGLFLIYDPDYSDGALRYLTNTVHNSSYDSLILLQSTDASLLERTGADGIFAYEAYQPVAGFYRGIAQAVRKRNGIFIPAVSPGFNINRTFQQKSDMLRGRNAGKNYDTWWERVIAARSEYVAILTFNEWHEGTQIEPADDRIAYLSYESAYGATGEAAEVSYLRRTARWIRIFKSQKSILAEPEMRPALLRWNPENLR